MERRVPLCGLYFHSAFKQMEEDGKLDPMNEIIIDIYCLHRVFEPRINAALGTFSESWNNHPISGQGRI